MSKLIFEALNEIEEIINSSKDPVMYFILNALDDADLIEHGSSIIGSWLSPLGKEYIQDYEYAKENDLDFDEEFVCKEDEPEGGKYADLWFSKLKQCACGQPWNIQELIYRILKTIDE